MATSCRDSPPPPPPPPTTTTTTTTIQTTAAMTANGVSVVVVPLPAQGHLNQFLHLSHLLAARGLSVHFVSFAGHNRQARGRYAASAAPSPASPILFHDLPFPPFPSPPSPPSPPASSFPSHLQPAWAAAAAHFPSPLSSLLRSLAASSRRVILLHDSTMSFAASVAANASIPHLSAFALHTVSAFALLHFLRQSRGAKLPPDDDDDIRNDDCFSSDFLALVRSQHGMISPHSCRLLNTCHAIEGEFVDQLAKEPAWKAKKTYTIGPLIPTTATRAGGGRRHDCLKWLDTQRPTSVLYVSFGTTSLLTKEQIAELAAGLEAAGVPFVWVVRRADCANIYDGDGDVDGDGDGDDDVSREFERRVEGRGVGRVVRGWAPQREVLWHGSTGGFMSHCGWNSCMESMSAGVPMLTWPMHSDQPRNAALVSRVLGAGAAAREWAARGHVIAAGAIRDSVVRFMLGDEGAAARRRARAVGDQLRRAAADGGSSRTDFDAFVADITK